MSRLLAALRTLLYATVFLGLWAWLALQVRPLDSFLGLSLPPGARVAGAALMLVGLPGALACAGTFVFAGRGTPAPFDPPREFVAVGPYRWVRNPMYIAGVVLLVGFGLWHRSEAMTLFAALFGVAAHLFVVLWEEPRLAGRFGDRYLAYRDRVNRWIPRPPR